ncbi:MAG: hypothetical protein ACI4EG_15525 [Fusicatenibacter sp.]
MKIGIVVCIILTLFALESGDMLMVTIFGGLGVLLFYLKATEKKRKQREAEKTRRRAEEAERKRAAELRNRSNQRFGNSNFANMVVRNLQHLNWTELDDVNGIRILFQEIITPSQKYRYIDYGLAKLDAKGTQELADYIRSFYHGDDIEVSEIVKTWGGYTGGYTGYVGSDGNVSIARDWSGGEHVEGYKIHRIRSKQQPQGMKW